MFHKYKVKTIYDAAHNEHNENKELKIAETPHPIEFLDAIELDLAQAVQAWPDDDNTKQMLVSFITRVFRKIMNKEISSPLEAIGLVKKFISEGNRLDLFSAQAQEDIDKAMDSAVIVMHSEYTAGSTAGAMRIT